MFRRQKLLYRHATENVFSKKGFPKVLRSEPQGFASQEYKQEAFYPASGAIFTIAIQMYSAVFSVPTEPFRSNEFDLKKHKLRERERR